MILTILSVTGGTVTRSRSARTVFEPRHVRVRDTHRHVVELHAIRFSTQARAISQKALFAFMSLGLTIKTAFAPQCGLIRARSSVRSADDRALRVRCLAT